MVPKSGDKVMINPAWITEHDPRDGVYAEMKRNGFVGNTLVVTSVESSIDWVLISVSLGDITVSVFLDRSNGGYTGAYSDIPFFIHAGASLSLHGSCLLCGSPGWAGFNMFHCQNAACRNGR